MKILKCKWWEQTKRDADIINLELILAALKVNKRLERAIKASKGGDMVEKVLLEKIVATLKKSCQ